MSIDKSYGDFETITGGPKKPGAGAFNSGDRIGDYRLIKLLGHGGMGEVYLSENIHTRKTYALKILPAELSADKGFIDRFRVEARVMSDLSHPNIVSVHHMGEDKGVYYLMMDYVAGSDGEPRTLEDELRQKGKMPEETAKKIAFELCSALDYAHNFKGQGILHRDLKPANILLEAKAETANRRIGESETWQKTDDRRQKTDDGKTSNQRSVISNQTTDDRRPTTDDFLVKVSDFGLAKIIGGDYLKSVIEQSIRLTFAGAGRPAEITMGDLKTLSPAPDSKKKQSASSSLIGTYEYMSPEQQEGHDATVQSDIYSLGIIFYRMLTGQKPKGVFKLPSKFGVSKDWDEIISKCLQTEAEERYSSVEEIMEDVSTTKAQSNSAIPARDSESAKRRSSSGSALDCEAPASLSISLETGKIQSGAGVPQSKDSQGESERGGKNRYGDQRPAFAKATEGRPTTGKTFMIVLIISILLVLAVFFFWDLSGGKDQKTEPVRQYNSQNSQFQQERLKQEEETQKLQQEADRRKQEEDARKKAEEAKIKEDQRKQLEEIKTAKKKTLTQKISQQIDSGTCDLALNLLNEYSSEFGQDEYYKGVEPVILKAKSDADKQATRAIFEIEEKAKAEAERKRKEDDARREFNKDWALVQSRFFEAKNYIGDKNASAIKNSVGRNASLDSVQKMLDDMSNKPYATYLSAADKSEISKLKSEITTLKQKLNPSSVISAKDKGVCPICNGKGRKKCERCSGYGKDPDFKSDDGTSTDCTICKGIGYMENICTNCNGTGNVKE